MSRTSKFSKKSRKSEKQAGEKQKKLRVGVQSEERGRGRCQAGRPGRALRLHPL
jgi:hypothetical protein